jgi:hypothetical protein
VGNGLARLDADGANVGLDAPFDALMDIVTPFMPWRACN